MILKKMSFKNVKRNEIFTKNKKTKNKKKKIKFQVKKSSSDYNLISINIDDNDKLGIFNFEKKNNTLKKENSYINKYILNDNVNNIISNLKQENTKNNYPQQSTDFSSNILNNNISNNNVPHKKKINFNSTSFSFSHKAKRRQDYKVTFQNKRDNSSKLNNKLLENTDFSTLLKNQQNKLLKKGDKRIAKSSIQMPYIKKRKIIKNQKYNGLYNMNLNKETDLQKEINNLMTINQNIKLSGEKKSKSFCFKNNKNNIGLNINNLKNEKILNIKIKFTFQRNRDKFIEKNRLLMKQNYFKNILNERVSKIENKNIFNEKKLIFLKNKIKILKDWIIHFKINNIINHDLKLLKIILEKNILDNYNLIANIKKYNKEIDKLNTSINIHINKRNEIKFWYEFLCKIKGEIPLKVTNDNYNNIVQCLLFDEFTKGFHHLAQNIVTFENNYKNIYDEKFILNKEKDLIYKKYQLMIEKDMEEIKDREKELNSLKDMYTKLSDIKIKVMNKETIDFLDLEKYSNIKVGYRYNSYLKKETNKIVILLQKISNLFENYINYIKNEHYYKSKDSLEQKKINKIEKQLLKYRNNNKAKSEYIKKNIFEILFIVEKFVNFIVIDINQQRMKIGKEKFKKILNKAKLIKSIEKKLIILYDKEKMEEENIIRKENKIYFLPIKKVYVPYMAIKNENLKKLKSKSFSIGDKSKYKLNINDIKNKKKNKKSYSFYEEDEDDSDKYDELFF